MKFQETSSSSELLLLGEGRHMSSVDGSEDGIIEVVGRDTYAQVKFLFSQNEHLGRASSHLQTSAFNDNGH
jgi:hypothetical protein